MTAPPPSTDPIPAVPPSATGPAPRAGTDAAATAPAPDRFVVLAIAALAVAGARLLLECVATGRWSAAREAAAILDGHVLVLGWAGAAIVLAAVAASRIAGRLSGLAPPRGLGTVVAWLALPAAAMCGTLLVLQALWFGRWDPALSLADNHERHRLVLLAAGLSLFVAWLPVMALPARLGSARPDAARRATPAVLRVAILLVQAGAMVLMSGAASGTWNPHWDASAVRHNINDQVLLLGVLGLAMIAAAITGWMLVRRPSVHEHIGREG